MNGVNFSFFEKMPDELVLEVFEHLDGKDLGTCAQACKRFNILSNHGSVVTKKINLPKTITDIGGFITSMSTGFRKEVKALSEIMKKTLFDKKTKEISYFGKSTFTNEDFIADLYIFIVTNWAKKEECAKALALCIRFFANTTLDFDYDKLKSLIEGIDAFNEDIKNPYIAKLIGTIIVSSAFLREKDLEKEFDMYDKMLNYFSLLLYPSASEYDLKFHDLSNDQRYDLDKSFFEYALSLKYVLEENFDLKPFEKFQMDLGLHELSFVRDMIRLLPPEIKEYFSKDVLQALDPVFNKFLEHSGQKDVFIEWGKKNPEIKQLFNLNLTLKDIV